MSRRLIEYLKDNVRTKDIEEELINKVYSKTFGGTNKVQDYIDLLGPSVEKVLSVSDPRFFSELNIDNTTAIGGWCVIRTTDHKNISKGFLINPSSGEKIKIKTINDVTNWIREVQSFDQITESTGIYNGSNYIIISEVRLWSEKISTTLEKLFQRALTNNEINEVRNAVNESEERKFEITKRYISACTGNNKLNILRVKDVDYFDSIISNRDKLFSRFELTFEKLATFVLERRKSKGQYNENEDVDVIINYIREYSISWYFFTGDYVENILRANGIIKTKFALLINPWLYALSKEFESERFFNETAFSGVNTYLNPKGENSNLAYASLSTSDDYSYKPYKTTKTIADLPNTVNFNQYIAKFHKSIDNLSETYIIDKDEIQHLFNFLNNNNAFKKIQEILVDFEDFSNTKKSINEKDYVRKQNIISQIRNLKLSKNKPVLKELANEYTDLVKKVFTL